MTRMSASLFHLCLTLAVVIWGYRLIYLAGPWGFQIGQQDLVAWVHWFFVLLGAVMPYALLLALGLLGVFLLVRKWRWAGFLLALTALEIGFTFSQTMRVSGEGRLENEEAISVAAFNMQANRQALAAFAALSQDTDVIYLSEVPQAYEDINFPALFPAHDLHQVFYYPGYRGSMVVLLRGDADVGVETGADGNLRPILDIRLEKSGEEVRILASHPLAPFFPFMMTERNHTLNRFHALVDSAPGMPTILIGDMNTTPFEVDGWRLPGRLVGNPLQPSWSGLENIGRWKELAQLRIDHIRFIEGAEGRVRPISQQVGPDLGSDHLPVFAEFIVN